MSGTLSSLIRQLQKEGRTIYAAPVSDRVATPGRYDESGSESSPSLHRFVEKETAKKLGDDKGLDADELKNVNDLKDLNDLLNDEKTDPTGGDPAETPTDPLNPFLPDKEDPDGPDPEVTPPTVVDGVRVYVLHSSSISYSHDGGAHFRKFDAPVGAEPTKREGLRVEIDIIAGCEAMDALLADLNEHNAARRRTQHHHRQYRPRLVFLEGNHEERLRRIALLHPALRGFLDDEAIEAAMRRRGWEWHRFLQPVEIVGVTFAHYFETPGTGKPLQIAAWPAKIPFSAVWAHTHQLHHRIASLPFGRSIAGLCAGSFRDELPPSAPHEWSGVLMLHDCAAGAYDLELISTERLIRDHPGLLAA